MGRPASNGAPSFRFNSAEVTEMESILQAHKYNVPERDLCQALADKFSRSAEREGKVVVQMKQIWNWFQNRRYAIRAKNSRAPGKLNVAPLQRNDMSTVRSVSQAPQHLPVPPASSLNNMLQVPQPIPAHSGQIATKNGADNSQLEFEAKSSRDGAWYDVSSFLSHRSLENGGPAVLVRFAGFGPEEDEWINVQKNVRLRSLPCESSECVAVLPNDLILCFQEGKEQALYYDAHVLDAQRRRHDARGCRCRFLVRYDHDQSEEIVALRKVCRRPETDYRLQQLHADSANSDKNKSGSMHHPPGKSVQVNPITVADSTEKKPAVIPAQTTPKQPVTGVHPKSEIPVMTPVSFGNMPSKMSAVPLVHSIASLPPPSAGGAVDSSVSKVTTTIPVADNTSKQPTTMITSGVIANTDTVISLFALTNTSVSTPVVPMDHSNAPPSAGAVDSNVSKVINTAPVDDSMPMQPPTMTGLDANTCEMPMNHSNSPLAVSVDSSISVSVADATPEQPANTPPLTAPDILASADVNISTVPDSHSNASLFSASAGAAVDSSVSTMVTNTDPAALSSMPNQPSSTGVDANTGAVISPVSPANTSVDSSVVSVHNTDPVLDSSSSLTYTASPATILNDTPPVVTEITTSLEKSATIDDEGNLNNVDADPVVASDADNLSNVTEDPVVAGGADNLSDVIEVSVLAGGANHISDVTEDPVLAGGANHISDVSEDPVLASAANHASDVTEDPGVASAANHASDVSEDPGVASGANLVSDVSEDPGVASGANLISDVSEDPGENMQID